MDRALGFGPRGCGFDSCRPRHKILKPALIAQLVEQLPLKQTVLGSNPSGRTNIFYYKTIAQLVDPPSPVGEWRTLKQTVLGSPPAGGLVGAPLLHYREECSPKPLATKSTHWVVFLSIY